jgi:hypothetical protein
LYSTQASVQSALALPPNDSPWSSLGSASSPAGVRSITARQRSIFTIARPTDTPSPAALSSASAARAAALSRSGGSACGGSGRSSRRGRR